jgi:hypothetical protein
MTSSYKSRLASVTPSEFTQIPAIGKNATVLTARVRLFTYKFYEAYLVLYILISAPGGMDGSSVILNQSKDHGFQCSIRLFERQNTIRQKLLLVGAAVVTQVLLPSKIVGLQPAVELLGNGNSSSTENPLRTIFLPPKRCQTRDDNKSRTASLKSPNTIRKSPGMGANHCTAFPFSCRMESPGTLLLLSIPAFTCPCTGRNVKVIPSPAVKEPDR